MAEQVDPRAAPLIERANEAFKATGQQQRQYWTNLSFTYGEQWVYWSQAHNRLEALPDDEERYRVTANRILPAIRTNSAKLLQRPLTFEVPPESADDASIRASRIAEAVVRHHAQDSKWEELRKDLIWNAWIGGTAALSLDWDTKAGTKLGVTPSGKEFGTGDLRETSLSILDFAVQPGVRDAEYAQWWVRSEPLPPEEVRERYELSETPAPDAAAGLSGVQKQLVRASSGLELTPLTKVLTYYERPNDQHENGRVVVIVGNKIVDEGEWPFEWEDRLNLIIIRESHRPGRWTGETVVSSAVPLQAAYNAAWSNFLEHLRNAGAARLLVPESAVDLIDELTDMPGEILPYPDGSDAPGYLTPPSLPNWFTQQMQALAVEMDDLLGIHDVSRGQAPGRIESGLGVQIISENDGTPLGNLAKETARLFSKLASMTLKTYETEVTGGEKRSATTKDIGGLPERTEWTGKDIKGATTALVPEDSVIPRSRAAQNQFAIQAMQAGLVQDPRQVARLMEFPGQEDLMAAIDPDIARARRENHRMAQGLSSVVTEYDDNAKHIVEHDDFRKSVRYELLDPEDRERIDDHIAAHETLAAEKAGRRQAQSDISPLLAATPESGNPAILGPDGLPLPPAAPPAPAPIQGPPAGLPPAGAGIGGGEGSLSPADIEAALMAELAGGAV